MTLNKQTTSNRSRFLSRLPIRKFQRRFPSHGVTCCCLAKALFPGAENLHKEQRVCVLHLARDIRCQSLCDEVQSPKQPGEAEQKIVAWVQIWPVTKLAQHVKKWFLKAPTAFTFDAKIIKSICVSQVRLVFLSWSQCRFMWVPSGHLLPFTMSPQAAV